MEVVEWISADKLIPEPEVSEVPEAHGEGEELGLDVRLSGLDCWEDSAREVKISGYDKNST